MTEIGTATTDEQLDTLRTGAGIYPLDDRAFLRITGSDATRWLNGMVTNNIKDLAPGEGNYNFLLNNQGRIQADCTIYREPHEGDPTFLLETDKSQIETIQQHLDKFIIMDDVELSTSLNVNGVTVDSSQLRGLGLVGKDADDKLASAMMTANEFPLHPPPEPGHIILGTHNGKHASLVIASPGTAHVSYEIWSTDAGDFAAIRNWLLRDGAIELSPETLEALRILEARPKFGQDIRDKDLPQETAQTHALHFSKGCYLGQEIVERIHSRGQVHRTFTQFTLTGDLPQLPAIIESNGKAVGELTSAAEVNGQLLALGYLRREAFNQPLTYPGGTATQTPRQASNSSH
ncbi:MAG: folate-binding protein [Acidobacteriota bacterium]